MTSVVHRDREEEHRRPRVEEALRLESEQAGAVPILEDQPADARGSAGRDRLRELMLALFAQLGQEHPVAIRYRRRLASALY